MLLKTQLPIITYFTALAIGFLLWIGIGLNQRISHINSAWESHNQLLENKARVLYKVHEAFGYGGFIHHFKNLVIRLDNQYLSLTAIALSKTYNELESYNSLRINHKEKIAKTFL